MRKYLVALLLFLPGTAFAARTLRDLAGNIIDLINLIIPLLFALAILGFFWGLTYNFFLRPGSKEGQDAGKKIMLWGIVAMFVMASVWGILRILRTSIFGS